LPDTCCIIFPYTTLFRSHTCDGEAGGGFDEFYAGDVEIQFSCVSEVSRDTGRCGADHSGSQVEGRDERRKRLVNNRRIGEYVERSEERRVGKEVRGWWVG